MIVVEKGVDRHELDGRDPERFDVIDDLLRAESGVSAAQMLLEAGIELREAFDVGLIDDRAIPGDESLPCFAAPVEIRIDDHAFRHIRTAFALVEGQARAGLRYVSTEILRVPPERPHKHPSTS